jgi:hypothetical protein
VVNIPLGITLPTWGPTAGARAGEDFEGSFLVKLFATFLFFVCALLLSALVPDRIRLISEEAPHRLFSAFVFGLIGYMVFVFSQLFLTITVIGIPLVFLLYLVFVVLKWLAMCGIFHQIGRRMGRGLGREMSLLGAILLGMLPFALLRFVPFCIGFASGSRSRSSRWLFDPDARRHAGRPGSRSRRSHRSRHRHRCRPASARG